MHEHAGPDHRPHRGESDPGQRASAKRALALVLALTAGFTVAEVVGGLLTNSLALLADAGHMLSDSIALAVALLAIRLAERPPTPLATARLGSASSARQNCGCACGPRRWAASCETSRTKQYRWLSVFAASPCRADLFEAVHGERSRRGSRHLGTTKRSTDSPEKINEDWVEQLIDVAAHRGRSAPPFET